MNAVSVFCGVVGNIFLLLNFTQTVRYIVALPVTIALWFLATGIVSQIFSFSWRRLTLFCLVVDWAYSISGDL